MSDNSSTAVRKSINRSYSTRPPLIKVNLFRFYKYDELFAGGINEIVIAIILTAILSGLAIGFFVQKQILLLCVLSVCILLMFRRIAKYYCLVSNFIRLVKKGYYQSLITPAIIIGLKPIKLAHLVHLNTGNKPIYLGFKICEIKRLPEHNVVIGERVPCVSRFSRGNHVDRWEDFLPKPISWGTGNINDIKRCLNTITNEEFVQLEQIISRNMILDDTLIIMDEDMVVIEKIKFCDS